MIRISFRFREDENGFLLALLGQRKRPRTVAVISSSIFGSSEIRINDG